MDGDTYNLLMTLLGMLPSEYRLWVSGALQIMGMLVAVLSVLVPLIEKLVKTLPCKNQSSYFDTIARVRAVLSLFPRVIVPRISVAPTKPAPVAEEMAPHEIRNLEIPWPKADSKGKKLP